MSRYKVKTYLYPIIENLKFDKEENQEGIDFEYLKEYSGYFIDNIKKQLAKKGYIMVKKPKVISGDSNIDDPLKSSSFYLRVKAKYIGKRKARERL